MKERDIENLLEQQLLKNGWVINVDDKNRNVYHQRPKAQEDIAKLKGLEPDFCLYLSEKSVSPEIVIEEELINSKEELINVFSFANQKLRKAGITKGMERFFEFSNLLFLKI